MRDVIQATGSLFGDLWHRYDDKLFEESVALFTPRFEANGFDLSWFRGKRCLDAGCGGGRYSIGMARHGAREVIGCDISIEGIRQCRERAAGILSAAFEVASVLDLPFRDESFDFVCSSGVLHHTSDPERGLRELTRVLRPGGRIFLLLYGARGLRWPTIMKLRPYAQARGYDVLDRAMRAVGLPANKQRTFLDDLFVPLIAFYEWAEVSRMMNANGYTDIQRWEKGKLDHESSVEEQRYELDQLRLLFSSGLSEDSLAPVREGPAQEPAEIVADAIARLDNAVAEHRAGRIDDARLNDIVFGAGHHRVLAVKP